jgi:hypothetical protein
MVAPFVSPRVLIAFAIALAAIVVSSPLMADGSWREVDSGTPTLFDAMAYDEARQQLVLFAGDAYNVTWIWNGSGWTKLNPPTRPGQRLGARMAYDPNTQTVIMFGGNDLTIGLLNETWSWNGTTWTQLHPAHAPSARFAPGLVYDVAENKLVLFGGEGANSLTQEDTWTWDGSDWTQQITDVGPSPRFWPAMAYDPDSSSVVLFGGQSGVPSPAINDTWTWTGAGWSLQTPITSPPGRGLTDMAYSPISHRVVLFGGTNLLVGPASTIDGLTWEWDGTNWSSQQISPGPGPRFYNSLALDKASGNVILQGGSNLGGSPFGETWIWNGSTWNSVPDRVPGKRYRGAMALDSTHRQTVLFGGLSITDSYLGDTWTWDGVSWTQHQPTITPSARLDPALAEDPAHGNVILFGGQDVNGYSGETWIWDGVVWTLQHPTNAPSARSGASMAYDAHGAQVILFGGQSGGAEVSDTWAWDGENWSQLSPTVSPSARQDAGLAQDANGHLVLFGGALTSGVAGDTWTWDGTNWMQNTPTNSPPPRRLGTLGHSPQLGAVILFGGFDANGSELGDTWEWDGNSWTQLTASVGPGVRNGHALAESPNGDVILFGDIDRNDTWSLGVTPVQLNRVVSRKIHGNAGTFDLDLSLTGNPGIECRSGGANGEHTLVFAFLSSLNTVSSVTATASTSSGTVPVTVLSTSGIGTDAHQYIANLSGVPNASHLTVTLNAVTDSAGDFGDVSARMDVLLGDVNATGRTDSGDVTAVRNKTVSIPDQQTFQFDVNTSGRIDSGDVTVTRNASVTVLP